MKNRPQTLVFVALALAVATALLFARAIGHEFVNYDDPDYVTANPHVQQGLTGESVRWAFSTSDISYWHPLTWLSHMLDWELFGDRPAGHHAVSVGWHALNAALAFLVFTRLTGSWLPSLVVAALFAWHPLRVESVAWVAERKDVLSGFFWLLTLGAYAAYANRRERKAMSAWPWYGLTWLAFVGGLMSKPMLVTLPCVLLVLDFWPLRRWQRATALRLVVEKLPFFAASAVVSWITIVAQTNVGTLSTALPFEARLANALVAIPRYLAKLVVPVDLAVLYPHPGHWPAGTVAFAVVVVGGLSALAWWQRARRPWLLAGWLWFLIALLPVSGVVQVGIQSMADRYTYLPMLGVLVAIAWTGRESWSSRAGRAVAAVVLVALAARTYDQLGVWRDSFTLFDHAIRVTENSYLAYNNRGLAAYRAGRVDDAIADYRRALEINAAYSDANNNLGYALAQQGRATEALPFVRAALAAKPDHVEIRNNLGNVLSDLGQIDEAIGHYRFVLEREPRHVNALNGLGVAHAMQGRLPEALAQFDRALAADPDNATTHANRGNACALLGRTAEAIGHYRKALAADPQDARTHFNLGNALLGAGQLADAAASYRRAVELRPVNPDAHAQLGYALARQGERDGAVRHLRLALEQRPDFPQARAWLEAVQGTMPANR